jgi:hypothetical protein
MQSRNGLHYQTEKTLSYNFAFDTITIRVKEVPQKPILKKPSIFHIKNYVPTNTYKFLKNVREIFEKIIFF